MFHRMERVLYRSLDLTVTTKRITVRNEETYSVRDITSIVPEVWSEWQITESTNPWRRTVIYTLVSGGALGLTICLLLPGFGTEGFGTEPGKPFSPVGLIAAGIVFVLSCGVLWYAWRLFAGTKKEMWCARITLHLQDEDEEVITLVSPLPLDDAIAAIEEALES